MIAIVKKRNKNRNIHVESNKFPIMIFRFDGAIFSSLKKSSIKKKSRNVKKIVEMYKVGFFFQFAYASHITF